MPQLDVSTFLPQIFWLVASFILLYIFLDKVCLPKLAKVFQDRDHKISRLLSKAESNKNKALQLKESYESQIAQALKKKSDALNEVTKDIALMMEHKILEHELELKVLLSNSEQKIMDFEVATKNIIKQVAQETAEEMLESILAKTADKGQLSKLVKQEFKEA
jgi:F-type H+-transporting ATPase subunit b